MGEEISHLGPNGYQTIAAILGSAFAAPPAAIADRRHLTIFLRSTPAAAIESHAKEISDLSGSNKLTAIEDWIFTQRRISFYGLGIAVAYLLSLAWRLVHGQWVILPDGRLRCIDFGWMWLSGRFAVSGNSAKIFDYSTFSAAQIALFGHDNCPFITPYVYPPTYLFMTYFLGFMPYLIAFAAWVLATLFLYGTAVYAIIPRRAAVIAAMSPFCVAVNADFGHNGYITAALIGFSLASWNGARGSPEYSWASSATSRISACCSRSRFWRPGTGEPSRARRWRP